MIDFKYHVVSLISVFLAIALGIIIGTTALNGGIVSNLQSNVKTLGDEKRDLEDRVTDLNTAVQQNSDFATGVSEPLVVDVLADETFIAITVGDSVTAEMRDPIISMIQKAGATNTGAISLTDTFGDPEHADELLKFASDDPPAGITLPESNNAGDVVGALLAAVLVSSESGSAAGEVTSVLSGLGSLGVLKLDSTDIQPASNFVIITSGQPSSDVGTRNDMALGLAMQLDMAGASVVIAGDESSVTGGGLITAAREDAVVASAVSTIDNANYGSGQVNVVWALAAEAEQNTGAYGTAPDTDPLAPAPN
ncbi:MAG: copper transporter [Cumulibacter sp.]